MSELPVPTSRRGFLQHTAGWAAAAGSLSAARSVVGSTGPNESLVLGAIGCGGQGRGLARSFAKLPGLRLAWVCDPDSSRAAEAAAEVEEIAGHRPEIVSDLRRVLDDPAVDAVTVATPDHWHGPAALLALAANKHVYVEKPCAHNVREGRLLVEAARRTGRVVQVGTQSRSGPHLMAAVERLRAGAIGEVLVAKAWNSQRRGNIGRATPSDPPEGVDYDLWLGPAPWLPFQANRFHYNWHWWYALGTGDLGNDGVHEVDIARWGLGVSEHPSRVTAAGGKLAYDDDQQFPDTQFVVYDYPASSAGRARQLIYEMRLWSPYVQEGHENGNAFYGTEGVLILGKRNGWQLFGPKNELRESMAPADLGPDHHRDFLSAIHENRRPQADIEIGHHSAALCHLGNIATRLGRVLNFDPAAEQIVGDDEAARLLGREYRPGHWAVPAGA